MPAITAFALLIEMPGTLDARQAASLAGLPPVTRQSDRLTGRAFAREGRAAIRQAIDIPAVVATRFNPDMKSKSKRTHQRWKASEKSPSPPLCES